MPPEAEPQEKQTHYRKARGFPQGLRQSRDTLMALVVARRATKSAESVDTLVKEQLCLRASLPAASVHFAWSTLP